MSDDDKSVCYYYSGPRDQGMLDLITVFVKTHVQFEVCKEDDLVIRVRVDGGHVVFWGPYAINIEFEPDLELTNE